VIPKEFRYVNRMLNIAYLTGTVRYDDTSERGAPRRFYLNQTANPALDIPIELPTPDFALPPQGEFRTVLAHVFGRVGEYGKTAVVRAITVTQSSVLSINPMSTYLLGFAKRLPKDKIPPSCPYDSSGVLKEEFLDQLKSIDDLTVEEKAIIEFYEQMSGRIRGRFDSYSNVVLMAGFVHRANYIPPNQYQTHGSGIIDLRQHKDLDQIVPVRVVNNKVSIILKSIRPGYTISLKGRIRRKVMPNADGTDIASDIVYVETDMLNAANQTQILPPPPPWFLEYLRRDDEKEIEEEVEEDTDEEFEDDDEEFEEEVEEGADEEFEEEFFEDSQLPSHRE